MFWRQKRWNSRAKNWLNSINLKSMVLNEHFFFQEEKNEKYKETFVSLGGVKDGCFIASGTGTFIALNMIITAKHVIDDYWHKFKHTPMKYPEATENSGSVINIKADFGICALQIIDGDKVAAWEVKHMITHGTSSDICYLLVRPGNPLAEKQPRPKGPKLHLCPPAVGSKLMTLGYINTAGKAINYNENGIYTVEWQMNFVSSGGIVREIHHESRDSSNLNFPCVHSNCRVDGGMSGGPVFNHYGNMFGINSMSLHPNDESEEHVSYAALIWPTLHWSFDVYHRSANAPMRVTLSELIRGGNIRATGLECFEVVNNDKGKVIGTKMTCQRLLQQQLPL